MNRANKNVCLIFLCLILSINTTPSWSQSPTIEDQSRQDQAIFLAGANEHGGPLNEHKTKFDCSEKIISVVDLKNYPLGKHHLLVKWIDPYSETRERTEYYFTIRESQTRVWAWLSFNRGKGASLLQWINPAAGLEDFIGIWKIDVKIDGKSIGKSNFEVSC